MFPWACLQMYKNVTDYDNRTFFDLPITINGSGGYSFTVMVVTGTIYECTPKYVEFVGFLWKSEEGITRLRIYPVAENNKSFAIDYCDSFLIIASGTTRNLILRSDFIR